MKVKFVSLSFLFIFHLTKVCTKDDPFRKSFFLALKELKGQFISEMDFEESFPERKVSFISAQNETYDFNTSTGLLSWGEGLMSDGRQKVMHHLYIDGEEIHQFKQPDYYHFMEDRFCYTYPFGERIQRYNSLLAPAEVFSGGNYSLLGPNVFLEVLHRRYEMDPKSVKCEQSKKATRICVITYKNSVRLNYTLVDGGGYTMYPQKIKVTKRNETTGEWRQHLKVTYQSLNWTTDGKLFESSDQRRLLPIRRGCTHLNAERYPKIQTSYGNKFELRLRVVYNYTDERGWEEEDDENLYWNQTVLMLADRNGSINIAEWFEEANNVSIRSFHYTDSNLIHKVVDGQCVAYNLTSTESQRSFLIQNLFVRESELLFTRNNYSFLREITENNVSMLVFERPFDYPTGIGYFDYERWKPSSKKSSSPRPPSLKQSHKNRRQYLHAVEYNRVIATHFYPKDARQWPNNPDRLAVPKRIELIIYWHDRYSAFELHHLTIHIESFKPITKKLQKYDGAKCTNVTDVTF